MTNDGFMTFERAVEILYKVVNETHLIAPQIETALDVVHDWLVNVAFDGTEKEAK